MNISSTSNRTAERNRARWLLRPLGEPAFLRLYLEESPCPRRLFEETFWSLPVDVEHPGDAREHAWERLRAWRDRIPEEESDKPVAWYCAVLQGLRDAPDQKDIRDLACFWAAPELLGTEEQPTSIQTGYYELHCHVRGAVPFLHLWRNWLGDRRARAHLRKHICQAGSWKETWAELVTRAAELWQQHFDPAYLCSAVSRHADDPGHIQELVDALMHSQSPEIRRAAGQYLAIYTGLRRSLLYQRGKSGLARFSARYDSYSKLQKRGGRRDLDQTRRDMVAILQQFEREGAVAVELRPTLDRERAPCQRKLQSLVLGYFDYIQDREPSLTGPLLLGLVPSLFKQEPCGAGEDTQRWIRQERIWQHQLTILLTILDEVPALRFFVVGIDAAGREQGCPPRVLASIFHRVRAYHDTRGLSAARPGRVISPTWLKRLVAQAGSARAAFDALNQSPVPPIRLGRTVHAGEDFIDPMTGLRHIWETLESCDLGPWDRIGHALAASLDRDTVYALLERRSRESSEVKSSGPEQWRLRKPRGVHAVDLAWLAQMTEDPERARWLAALGSLSANLLGVPVNAEHLATYLQTGLQLPHLAGARFRDPEDVAPEDCTWHMVNQEWLSMFACMRERVLDELARRQVVVESCPSSNLAVAGLAKAPIVQLMERGVRCAVATDDPGLLHAWPQRELAYLCEADRASVLAQNRAASFLVMAQGVIQD